MTKEQLKELVKSYFSLEEKNNIDNSEKTNFAEATLADGTKITNQEAGDFAVGQKLYVITEEGETVSAPSGEHTTESGIVVTVDENGDITGIKRPDEAGEGSLEDFSEETELSEETTKEESEDNATELAEHGDEEEAMEVEDSIDLEKEAIIEAIMEEMAPKIEALEEKLTSCMSSLAEHEDKLAEHDNKMKEHMSAPSEKSAMERKFSKVEKQDYSIKNKNNARAYNRVVNKLTNN